MEYLVKDVSKTLEMPTGMVAQIGQVIQPEIPANGRGHRAKYSFKNMVEIAIFHHLSRFGVPRKHIQRYLRDLGNSKFRWLENDGQDGWIVMDDQWRWGAGETPDTTIHNMARSYPVSSAITIDLGSIKQKIRYSLGLEGVVDVG